MGIHGCDILPPWQDELSSPLPIYISFKEMSVVSEIATVATAIFVGLAPPSALCARLPRTARPSSSPTRRSSTSKVAR